jgi:hypothetical protein
MPETVRCSLGVKEKNLISDYQPKTNPMKRFLSYLMAGAIVFASCTKSTLLDKEGSVPAQRMCAAMDVLEIQLAADPKLAARMHAIEQHTAMFRQSEFLKQQSANETIVIPVVVNVIYRTADQNISLEQIESQIDVLNEDFSGTNTDASETPDIFSELIADFNIRFVLHDVVRKYSNKKSWQLNDAMKSSRKGGIDATEPDRYLNMWVVNQLGSGRNIFLGYAQFPGGNPDTDGVVIAHEYFGRTGKVAPPYDLGRTATHEVGHWLNLRHIWGDATCGNDFVDDTPLHNTYNFGCPQYPHYSTCTGTPIEMTMNYMDYTNDACMFMFTEGQKDRSLAVFAPGGPRSSFVN